jgi:hypothetical protein
MSGGRSSQTNAPAFTDNRAVLGEGSAYANNGGSVSTVNYVLDGNAVGSALDFAGGFGRSALDFTSDANAGALSTVGQSFGFGRSALDFASDANAGAQSTVGQSFGFGRSAFDFAGDAQAGTLGTIRDTLRQFLNFGSDSQAGAFGATSGALGFGRSALDFASDTTTHAINTVRSGTSESLWRSLDFAGDLTDMALTEVRHSGDNALDLVRDGMSAVLSATAKNTDQALGSLAATQKLTADAYNDAKGRGAMTDKLLMAAVAAMGLVALMAVKK